MAWFGITIKKKQVPRTFNDIEQELHMKKTRQAKIKVKDIPTAGRVKHLGGVPTVEKVKSESGPKNRKVFRKSKKFLVDRCMWCKGTGRDPVFMGNLCDMCNGNGGTYETRLVIDQVIEEYDE